MRTSKDHYNYFIDTSHYIIPRPIKKDFGIISCDATTAQTSNGSSNASTNAGTLVADVMKDKFESVRTTLIDLFCEIESRSRIDESLTRKVREDICMLQNRMFEFDTYPKGTNLIIDKRREALEDRIFDLEKELRNQELRRWQEMITINKELRRTYREYMDIKRRFLMIKNGIK